MRLQGIVIALCTIFLLNLAIANAPSHRRSKRKTQQVGRRTSDLLVLSGGRTFYRLTEKSHERLQDEDWYVADETFDVALRPGSHAQDVALWTEGVPGVRLSLGTVVQTCPSRGEEALYGIPVLMNQATAVHLRVCLPYEKSQKWLGKLYVAAADKEPQEIDLAFESEEGIETRLFTPVASALLGLILGLIGGYLSFFGQQAYLRRAERAKAFRAAKGEHAAALRAFFGGDYADFLGSENEWGAERLQALRHAVIDREVYAVLPPDEREEFDRLSRLTPDLKQKEQLTQLLRRNFGEFII